MGPPEVKGLISFGEIYDSSWSCRKDYERLEVDALKCFGIMLW